MRGAPSLIPASPFPPFHAHPQQGEEPHGHPRPPTSVSEVTREAVPPPTHVTSTERGPEEG